MVDEAPLNVAFLPRWPDNPHQDQLAEALAPHGVRVVSVPRRHWFVGAILRARCRLVHLHAPDHFVVYTDGGPSALMKLLLFSIQLLLLRVGGIRIVWTLHDTMNHEGRHPTLDRWCRRTTGRLCDALLVHCQQSRRWAGSELGISPEKLSVIPHGNYIGRYPAPGDRCAARQALDLPSDALIMLVLGNLRDHKGIPALLEAFGALSTPNALLVIRGQPFTPEIDRDLARRTSEMPRVDYRPGFVPDAEVGRYLDAADVVVCSHTNVLSSGALALGMSHGRACIAPRLGCLPEMASTGGAFLYDPGAPEALIGALGQAVERVDELDAMGRRNLERIREDDWASIGARTFEVYRACLSRG